MDGIKCSITYSIGQRQLAAEDERPRSHCGKVESASPQPHLDAVFIVFFSQISQKELLKPSAAYKNGLESDSITTRGHLDDL